MDMSVCFRWTHSIAIATISNESHSISPGASGWVRKFAGEQNFCAKNEEEMAKKASKREIKKKQTQKKKIEKRWKDIIEFHVSQLILSLLMNSLFVEFQNLIYVRT